MQNSFTFKNPKQISREFEDFFGENLETLFPIKAKSNIIEKEQDYLIELVCPGLNKKDKIGRAHV